MFLAFIYINAIYINALDRGDPVFFINGQASVAKPQPKYRRYLCCFHPRIEILMRLYEIFDKSKKQDLTPITLGIT